MTRHANPGAVHAPLGKYDHTVAVAPGAEWLVISGQVGIAADGKLADGVRAQSEQAFRNILACLAEYGMTKDDLVKFTSYLTDSRFVDDFRAARSAVIGDDCRPTSTLLIVDGLASPDLLVEVEAWAARTA